MIRAIVIAGVLAAPAAAHAFPTGDQYDFDPMTEDGAGGIAFTGSPRSAGHTCDVCHTGAPRKIAIDLLADPVDLFSNGYEPDMQYRMRVVIQHEWAAEDQRDAGDHCGDATTPYSRCDDNGFSLEIADARGYPAGTFAPVVGDHCMAGATSLDVRVLTDGSAITQEGAHHGVTAWDLCWTAPGADAGPVTAYVAVVDGDGGHGTTEDPNTVDGDDVASGAVPIAERGGQTAPVQAGGCSAGGDAGWLLAVAIVVALARGQRRRRAAIAAALASALAATGCAHVRAHEKEYLAKRKMVFTPDPTETELDLHMQQSREGSSGGYGSAGGGCGCN